MGKTIDKKVNYLDSDLYRKAFQLALCTHELSMDLPEADRESLASDMVESAIAIPSSIAAWCRSRSAKVMQCNLIIVNGKCGRLECQLSLLHDLKYIKTGDYKKALALEEEVSRTLQRMILEVNA